MWDDILRQWDAERLNLPYFSFEQAISIVSTIECRIHNN